MKTITNFLLESIQKKIQGLNSYNYEEVCDMVQADVVASLEEYEIDIEIKEVWLHGSRLRNTAKPNSDLDVVIFYEGDFKEDSLFNIFHEDEWEDYSIEDIKVDINFVEANDDSDITDYKKKSDEYDKTKIK